MLECEIQVLGRIDSVLRIDEFQFLSVFLFEVRTGFGRDADPVDRVEHGQGAVSLDRDCKTVCMKSVDEIPIDVLADRLATSRGAIYKTLHDARKRLRGYLSDHGFDLPGRTKEVNQ